MKPIRGIREELYVHNPWDGHEHLMERTDVTHSLTEEGAVATHKVRRALACQCGCVRPAAGFCGECHRTVCEMHLVRCLCGKPLGPCHALFLMQPGGGVLVLCPQCGGAHRRDQVVRGITRALLSPFVVFGDRQ